MCILRLEQQQTIKTEHSKFICYGLYWQFWMGGTAHQPQDNLRSKLSCGLRFKRPHYNCLLLLRYPVVEKFRQINLLRNASAS